MPAFAGAVALGYRYVETDVHVTSDGILVAFHDDKLDRVTTHQGLIRERTWREVAEARVDGIEPVLRFDDLLTTFPLLRVNVDPKHASSVDPLIHMIETLGAIDRICIGSFSDARLRTLRGRLGPGLCTSMGPKEVARLRLDALSGRVHPSPSGCVQIPESFRGVTVTNAAVVRAAHRAGLQVHVWTVDDPAAMTRLLDLGVDGLMTDRPAALKEVLASRGQWAVA